MVMDTKHEHNFLYENATQMCGPVYYVANTFLLGKSLPKCKVWDVAISQSFYDYYRPIGRNHVLQRVSTNVFVHIIISNLQGIYKFVSSSTNFSYTEYLFIINR